jgi:DNA topoisomerase-1
VIDPAESADAAGLVHASDALPGYRRRRRGRSFVYLDTRGRPIRGPEILARLRSLAIPPAWTDVWISPDPRGHLQATGRDARRRKQYRYHPRWREVRDATKYHRMLLFARTLPRIRRRVERDLRSASLTREKVLALVTRLLEVTLIRVGNEEYARSNRSFGLTTLRDGHVRISGAEMSFSFRGKGGKSHRIRFSDRRLARIVARCQDLPGQELFQYLEASGGRRTVCSGDVNAYLREVAGQPFTAKDFRTWAGTVMAATALGEIATGDSRASASGRKRDVARAVEAVAERLGNTPAICRKCYVHPAIIEAYLADTLQSSLGRPIPRRLARELRRLRSEEQAVAAFLERELAAQAPRARRRGPIPARSRGAQAASRDAMRAARSEGMRAAK